MGKAGRAPSGTVSVESIKGRIRLRFRVSGVQRTLSIGVDNPTVRKFAEFRAKEIESDLLTGLFDHTLDKYRPLSASVQQRTRIKYNRTVLDIFLGFMKWKSKEITKRSLEKYTVTVHYLEKSELGNLPADSITIETAQNFSDDLKQNLCPRTLKERITLLKACWDFSEMPHNPWNVILRRIKVPPTQPPHPFTKEEIIAILEVFKQYYAHYHPYVFFLFSTGVRTAEAIGLRWGHISANFTSIWIGESLSKGQRKPTKTNKARTIPIPLKLQEVLKSLKPKNAASDSLVFTSMHGGAIDVDNFTKRYWEPVLRKAGVEYRRPYNTRHSFVSNCLENKMNPVTIAAITGHKVETLFEHYAGLISVPSIPDLF